MSGEYDVYLLYDVYLFDKLDFTGTKDECEEWVEEQGDYYRSHSYIRASEGE